MRIDEENRKLYEHGLEEAKRIVAAAMQMNHADNLLGLNSGWLFLNFLVREADKDYEKYKDRLR